MDQSNAFLLPVMVEGIQKLLSLAAAPFGNRSRCQTHRDRWNIWNMFPPVLTPIVFFTGERPQFPCLDKGRSIYLSCHPGAPIVLSHRSSAPSGCCSAPLAALLTTSRTPIVVGC